MSIQNLLTGNTYEAEVRYICKKMAGGGCVIRTNCILSFTEEEVEVSYETIVSCTPKEREADYSTDEEKPALRFKWSEANGSITIHGFDDYGTFTYADGSLHATKRKHDECIVFSPHNPA